MPIEAVPTRGPLALLSHHRPAPVDVDGPGMERAEKVSDRSEAEGKTGLLGPGMCRVNSQGTLIRVPVPGTDIKGKARRRGGPRQQIPRSSVEYNHPGQNQGN